MLWTISFAFFAVTKNPRNKFKQTHAITQRRILLEFVSWIFGDCEECKTDGPKHEESFGPCSKRPATDAGPQGPFRQPTWQHVSVGDLDAVMEGQNLPGVPTEGPSSPGSEHEMAPMPKTTSTWRSG